MPPPKRASASAPPGSTPGQARGPATADAIRIRGAREHNLKGVDVDVPRGRLVAVTGVSGSGKSSLAFDTLFREGQRRFLETLSAYARQFLGRMEKPEVDHVEGLSPAIAVDQRAVQRGPRSTVGTLTEIVDHLRVLFARAGTAHCPQHGVPLETQTVEAILRQLLPRVEGRRVHVLAPLVRDRKGQHQALFADLVRKGYVRARVDGEIHRLEEVPELARYVRHTVEVVIDRLRVEAGTEGRVREALDQAVELGAGDLVVAVEGGDDLTYSTQRTCPECGAESPPLEPRLFSFNSPHGACPDCDGLGVLRRPTEGRLVADPSKTIREGALAVTRKSGGALLFPRVDFGFLERVGETVGFDIDTPWEKMSAKSKRLVLRGTGRRRFDDTWTWDSARSRGSFAWKRRYRGVIGALERKLEGGGSRKTIEKFLETAACPTCDGTRLSETAAHVRLGGETLTALCRASVADVPARLDALDAAMTDRQRAIGRELLAEVRRRLQFLLDVGLSYLSLDRSADTLSGGEAQRIRLAAQLGAGLQGVTYVLDEPSIGLHARDQGRLLDALFSLRDAGNTVLVVEHDEATLRAADHLIDVGPGAGADGGHIVAEGSPERVARADSPTGRLLRGEIAMPAPGERRRGDGNTLRVEGAHGFNLMDVDLELPLGTFTVVTGVSGSGKSTLVNATLGRALARHLGREVPDPGPHRGLRGLEHVGDLVPIDAAPIGRTPRSNPATYAGAFTPIRDLFASLPEARLRGWKPGRFSFNVEEGRCSTCQGAGAQYVELQFLAPVTVKCPECGGHRFQEETLDVRFKGHSIADVLDLAIEDALALFEDLPKIARPLRTLCDVGLGYLRLGQPSTTISGGEAQRVKLAKHLQRRPREHTLYLLDEPTTGLHQQDVAKLVAALQRLVDGGHTVLVIEHNLDLVRAADHVIDLGPEGGIGGGRVVVAGTPEEVERSAESHTGHALRSLREEARRAKSSPPPRPAPPTPPDRLRVVGARTHNLREISVELPRDALTVVTGPSGSGKSSLALDTIHALGRQRFVESLSTYARQFLGSRDRPPVDRIEGLGPSVAVEARTSTGHPRSTVATTTEIHDHLRVLWSRAGTPRCPQHGEKLERRDASGIARRVLRDCEGARGWVVAPLYGPGADLVDDPAARFAAAREAWLGAGYARALVDGTEERLEEVESTAEWDRDTRVDLVIDRLAFRPADRARLAEAVEQAAAVASGRVAVVLREKRGDGRRVAFSTKGACSVCGFHLEGPLEPRHFSFNTHAGACPECDGLGQHWQCDPELLVDRPDLPLAPSGGGTSAISNKLGRYLTKGKGYYEHLLRRVAASHRIDLRRPFESLTDTQRDLLLHGEGSREEYDVKVEKHGRRFAVEEEFSSGWSGLCGHVDAWHKKSEDPGWRSLLERFMARRACRVCGGERLAPAPRTATVGKRRLPELLAMSVSEALAWLRGLRLSKARSEAVAPVLEELESRLDLIERVGLGYLTLDRAMSTLSGGEARRIRLSASLGSHLVGVCYVLDEPTVGLHPADIDRLTGALLALRDGGNTVVVVEHDEAVMRRADWIVDLGPGAGRRGGEVVAAGTPAEVEASPRSLTGAALRGELELERPDSERRASGDKLRVTGASQHNLKNVTFEARFGELTGVCGPSGSGKSTLVLDTFVPALRGEKPQGRWKRVAGRLGGGSRVVVVDASPIGRTPSSVPATAVGLLDPIRELFARLPEARVRGFGPAHFSFNSTRGRCPGCDGRGAIKVEMQFLADLWLTCEDCGGRRYRPEVLDVRFRGSSIADLLELSIEEAFELLEHQPVCARILRTLLDVGLGYLSLGQSSTTLSSGEAQRVKLAGELLRADGGERSVVVLDEPSTGLHQSDVRNLLGVLTRLAERGDAVIVVEHHVGILRACDRLVELGPGGGADGGRVVATGRPADLMTDERSLTGPYLMPRRARRSRVANAGAARPHRVALGRTAT